MEKSWGVCKRSSPRSSGRLRRPWPKGLVQTCKAEEPTYRLPLMELRTWSFIYHIMADDLLKKAQDVFEGQIVSTAFWRLEAGEEVG